MKLTVFAATGGIGRHILDQATSAGHDVTAVVRNPAKLHDTAARTFIADLAAADAEDLAGAVSGADAVLSGLGATSSAETGVAARGTWAIVDAMRLTGVRRLVVVSAAPVSTVASTARPHPPKYDAGDGFFMRHLLGPITKTLLRKHYADLAEMEDVLRDSGLDWTSVRPPQLTDTPLTGTYRVALDQNLRRGLKISRADVAQFMLRVLDMPATIGHAAGVAN